MTRSFVSHDTKQRVFRAVASRPAIRREPGVSILCYHSLDPNNPRRSATPELFEEHIRWLRLHCDLVPLEGATGGRIEGERQKVAITLDDGFADQHRYALPVLRHHGATATFFITTGRMDPALAGRSPGLRALDEEAPGMTWDQADDLLDEGMEVGAHTHLHPNLATLEDARVLAEMETSRSLITERLGIAVRSFAYPYGRPRRHHTATTHRLARQAGFDRAVSVHFRRVTAEVDPYDIPRFAVQQDDLKMLEAKLLGRLDVVGRWQEAAPLWAVRAVAGKHY